MFSDPLAFDTDADGLSDQVELGGADGLVACETLGVFCALDDSLPRCDDGNDATDPTLGDTDGDGTTDAQEANLGSNPLNPDLAVIVRLIELQPLNGQRIDDPFLDNTVKHWEFEIRVRLPLTDRLFTVVSTDFDGPLDVNGNVLFAESFERSKGLICNRLSTCAGAARTPSECLHFPGGPIPPDFPVFRSPTCTPDVLGVFNDGQRSLNDSRPRACFSINAGDFLLPAFGCVGDIDCSPPPAHRYYLSRHAGLGHRYGISYAA